MNTAGDQSFSDQLAAARQRLIAELAERLDVEAGLREATLAFQHRRVGARVAQMLDVDAGLAGIVPPTPSALVETAQSPEPMPEEVAAPIPSGPAPTAADVPEGVDRAGEEQDEQAVEADPLETWRGMIIKMLDAAEAFCLRTDRLHESKSIVMDFITVSRIILQLARRTPVELSLMEGWILRLEEAEEALHRIPEHHREDHRAVLLLLDATEIRNYLRALGSNHPFARRAIPSPRLPDQVLPPSQRGPIAPPQSTSPRPQRSGAD